MGSGEMNVEAVLVHLGRNASDKEVLAEMERESLRPATMVELLAFGAQYPETQREFPVVALGSVWTGPQGDRDVGYLWGNPGSRQLGLYWRGDDWFADYRFLAVRK